MSDDPQRGNPLETAPIPTLLLRYSVPTALTLMVNFLYNIVDQIFIGRGVGISGMTATNIAFPLVILVGAVSLLLGDGCAAYVSLALGRRQQILYRKCHFRKMFPDTGTGPSRSRDSRPRRLLALP